VNKHAPSSDGIKDLPAADAVALRAILDPAAYLDALTRRRNGPRRKIKNNEGG
jgi:hypothetical protein